MDKDMIFWDEMWNQSSTDPVPVPTPEPKKCTGNCSTNGTCNCKE